VFQAHFCNLKRRIPYSGQVSRMTIGHRIEQPKRRFVMNRSSIATTFTIAAVTALALGLAPAARAQNKGCSNATLQGTFAHTDTGFGIAPPQNAGPIALVGTLTFDGKGGLTGAGVTSANGNIASFTETGTYVVNPDCTGTLTPQFSLGFTAHYFFVIDDNGDEFQFICTDSVGISVVYAGTARRQFPVGNWRQ
jgi:hypothetical protein